MEPDDLMFTVFMGGMVAFAAFCVLMSFIL